MKTYVGDGNIRNHRLGLSEQKKSSSLGDKKMTESFSHSENRVEETNGNTENDNFDNGNISTDRTDTESASDGVNI